MTQQNDTDIRLHSHFVFPVVWGGVMILMQRSCCSADLLIAVGTPLLGRRSTSAGDDDGILIGTASWSIHRRAIAMQKCHS